MLPKISLLVVTYLEQNQKYLDLCLKSILNLNYPKDKLDVLVLSTGDYEPQTMGFRTVHAGKKMHFPEGCNFGVRFLEKDSKHIMILNDDTILTKNSLLNMVQTIGDAEAIIGPISTCDLGWRYTLPYIGYIDGGQFKRLDQRFYKYDELAPFADKIMDYDLPVPSGVWHMNWIAFYAVLIPRKVWDRLGGMDDKFLSGQDDLDMSLRCRKENIPVLICQNSLIIHFGGASADHVLTPEIRNQNTEYFTQKWGIHPSFFH